VIIVGVLGFVRAVAGYYKVNDGVRLNALLPGAVRTSLLEEAIWDQFPQNAITSMDLISKVVLGFLDGDEIVDSKNVRVAPENNYGQGIVASGQNFYVIPENEYCDEITANAMEHTRADAKSGLFQQ
jgi:NAD(P)-dependent dehydrogenase (short-subunit alcohol dehydrogenase family)